MTWPSIFFSVSCWGGGGEKKKKKEEVGDGEDKLKAVTFYHCSVNIYRQNYIYFLWDSLAFLRGGKSC